MATQSLTGYGAQYHDRQMIGRYELLDELKRKPGLAVYKALDHRSGHLTVLKTIVDVPMADAQSQLLREALRREAAAMARLRHPGIVRLLDLSDDAGGHPYLAMEYVSGGTLEGALGPYCLGEPAGFAQRLEIAVQIAAALDYMHQRGVVHRDIKPCNILLNENREPRIADFGIATVIDGSHQPNGLLPGTPSFVAPELLNDAPPSPRTDIFSFGVLFYWMLTGAIPFDGETVTEITYHVSNTEPPSVLLHNWALPKDLDRVLGRCLAKDPAARYPSAGQISLELARLRAGLGAASPAKQPSAYPGPATTVHSIQQGLPLSAEKVQQQTEMVEAPAGKLAGIESSSTALPAAMATERFGGETPEAANHLSRIALAYHKQGKLAAAERMHCEALRIRKRVFGPCHAMVATSLNNLAMIYAEQGRTKEARTLLECSLIIAERVYGPDHPKTALRRRNLTELRRVQTA